MFSPAACPPDCAMYLYQYPTSTGWITVCEIQLYESKSVNFGECYTFFEKSYMILGPRRRDHGVAQSEFSVISVWLYTAAPTYRHIFVDNFL
jgi:hypothetical protein